MAKGTLNLSIDEAAIDRARRYVEENDTSISKFVNDIFNKLPLKDDAHDFIAGLGPIGRRFVGVAKEGAGDDEDEYHQFLLEKYSK